MPRCAESSRQRSPTSRTTRLSASPACRSPTAARRRWRSISSPSRCGTAEGHRPWDLVPNSTMTNATVSQMVKGVQGNEITLKYKEGEKKIVVVPETVIVTYVPGDKSELKPGSKIFIAAANKKDDGTLEAAAVSVGRDGITPPM